MRPYRIPALIMSIFFASSTGQAAAQKSPVPRLPQSGLERALFKLEDDWTKGLVKRDTMIFQRLTAPGFVYTEDATLMTREQVIKGVVTSGDKVEWAGNEEMKVHDFGAAAIVTGILTVKSRGPKGPFTTRYRFTDTWLNRNGRWQAIGAQDYVIPDRPSR